MRTKMKMTFKQMISKLSIILIWAAVATFSVVLILLLCFVWLHSLNDNSIYYDDLSSCIVVEDEYPIDNLYMKISKDDTCIVDMLIYVKNNARGCDRICLKNVSEQYKVKFYYISPYVHFGKRNYVLPDCQYEIKHITIGDASPAFLFLETDANGKFYDKRKQ